MSKPRSSRLAVVPSADRLLARAGRTVEERVHGLLTAEGLRLEDALALLDEIVRDLRAALAEPAALPLPDAEWWGHPLSGSFLLELTGEVLATRDGPEAAMAAIEVLTILEAARNDPRLDRVGATDDLEQRLRAPDAFQLLVEVAHDFRSPLTSILFLAETLRDGHSGPVTEIQHSQLGLVYSAAFGLASIASDVMDLARQERDLIDPEPEDYAIAEVFTSVERLVQPVVDEKRLTLRVVVPERSRAHGHPHALSRVILNLATNALKFTDEGSVEIGAVPRPRGRLEYYVQDTGRGIPEERQAELFHPFKRRIGEALDGHFFSGSGIGLSIARRLVVAMHGELMFRTSDDEGTRFWFEVPAERTRLRRDPAPVT